MQLTEKTIISSGLACFFLFLFLGIFNIMPWNIAGVIATASIGASSLLSSYVSKKKEKVEVKKPTIMKEKASISLTPKPKREVEYVINQAPVINEDEYVTYDVELQKGENLKGEIKADGTINVFLLTRRSLTRFERDKEFWYEDGDEEVRRTTIDFTAPKDGKWFIVVVNLEEEPITADIRVYVI